MKTFLAAAFLLALFLPHHAVAKNKVEGEIDVSLAINCIYDANGQPLDESEGEIVEGTCDFKIKTDRRFRKKKLRRNLKKHKSDDEFFVTFQNCNLEGRDTLKQYRLFDGVFNFQDTMFTQDILDVNGVEIEVETIFRTLNDQVRLEDPDGKVVAIGTKLTEITIEENADGDNELASINKLDVQWKAENCNALKDVNPNPPGFIFVSGPSDP
jgi:hypothetical protein